MLTVQDAYSAGVSSAFGRFKLANPQNLLHLAMAKSQAKNPIGYRNPATYMAQGPTSTQVPMAPQQKKTGAIFGAEVPDAIEHAAIPYEHRRQLYEDYARQKAQEEPTGYGKAMGIGGLVGGLGGAALGALGANNPALGAAVGGGLGGLLGAGTGGIMAHSDKGNIEHAQHVMSHEDNLDPALAKQIQDMIESRRSAEQFSQTRRDWRDSSRHDELMNALRNRGGI